MSPTTSPLRRLCAITLVSLGLLLGWGSGLCAQSKTQGPLEGLCQRYPRSRALLAELKRSDPQAYQAVLAASRKLRIKERREALLFVREHHPALGKVLVSLKQSSPKSFESGITQVVRDLRRIRRRIEQDPSSRKRVIRAWRRRSELRLEAARLVKQEDEGPLLSSLREQLMKEEMAHRAEIAKRIERLEAQIDGLRSRLGQDPKVMVERVLHRWQQGLKKGRNARRRARSDQGKTGGRK